MPFRFYEFAVDLAGGGVPLEPDIVVYVQAADRYESRRGYQPSVAAQLCRVTLESLPIDYDGFKLQRSGDGGGTWADVTGWVRDAFYAVDVPPSPGAYRYRAVTRTVDGATSSPGNEVEVTVVDWGDVDETGVQEVDAQAGAISNRLSRGGLFPAGFDGDPPCGTSVGSGSVAGGWNDGSWYARTREFDPPVVIGNVPPCGAVGVLLPLVSITFTIRDQPYPPPTSGSGIDDPSVAISLSVQGYLGGAILLVYPPGGGNPFAPDIVVAVVPGADPLLDRDVTITLDPSIVGPLAVVTVYANARDLDGNEVAHVCSFTSEDADVDPPDVANESPACGTGVDPSDDGRAPRDAAFSFKVSDDSSGVDQTTLQVYHGPSSVGPWTQVLQNGSVWLAGFTGSVVADGSGGFDVIVRRPVADPLWSTGAIVCFRVMADDLAGNGAEEVCCFRTAGITGIRQIVPVGESVILVEFDNGLSNDRALRDPSNWSIDPLDGSRGVVVRDAVPQGMPEDSVGDNPGSRYGVGDPVAVFLGTTPHDHGGRYRLTVGAAVRDRFGLSLGGTTADYRGRRTKFDEATDTVKGLGVEAAGGIPRAVALLGAIARQDDAIGGTYLFDDFEGNGG